MRRQVTRSGRHDLAEMTRNIAGQRTRHAKGKNSPCPAYPAFQRLQNSCRRARAGAAMLHLWRTSSIHNSRQARAALQSEMRLRNACASRATLLQLISGLIRSHESLRQDRCLHRIAPKDADRRPKQAHDRPLGTRSIRARARPRPPWCGFDAEQAGAQDHEPCRCGLRAVDRPYRIPSRHYLDPLRILAKMGGVGLLPHERFTPQLTKGAAHNFALLFEGIGKPLG